MKIALLQLNHSFDIDQNLAKAVQYVNEHAADFYVFPESYLTGYTSNLEELTTLSLTDDRLNILLSLATEKDCHIFIGANIKDKEQYYIGYLHIHQKLEVYYKTHLGLKEQLVFASGDTLKVFGAPVKAGVCLCIESHFPEIATKLRANGAEMLIVPFASPKVCGNRKEIWHKYLPARAYDNQMYVFAVNLCGNRDHVAFGGGILALDPKGNMIASYFDDEEHIEIVDIDLAYLAKLRRSPKLSYFERRRPELY